MKHHIHAKLSDLSIERNDLRVVGIPVSRNHLDATQTKFVVATSHFFDHQINSLLERPACQPGNRIQNTEAVKPFWSLAAYISTIVIVFANIIKVLIRQLPGMNIQQWSKYKGYVHLTCIQACHYSLGVLSRF